MMHYVVGLCRRLNTWLKYRGYSRCPDCGKVRYILGFRVGRRHDGCLPF